MKRAVSFLLALLFVFPFLISNSFAAISDKERENNEKYIYEFLKRELELNDAEACGVLANIYGESKFDPNAYCIDVDGYESYGLCQWHVGRLYALYSYCEENGLDSSTVEGQMQYLKYELNTSEKFAYSMILGIPNNEEGAYTAGYNWCRYFGRGASSLYEYRANLSKNKYWPKYGGSATSVSYARISEGTYFFSNNSNGKYLTVPSHAQNNGADVALGVFADNDYFKVNVIEDKYGYVLKPKFTYSSVVNIYATIVADGKNVTLYEPTGSNSQAWYFEAVDDGYVIRSVQKEECVLDVSSDGSVKVMTYKAGKKSQIWSLTPADVPSPVTPVVSAPGDIYPTVIEWEAAEKADLYVVTIYDAASGSIFMMERTNAVRYEAELPSGEYSVKIDSYNTSSKMSASGDSVSFTVDVIHVHDFSGRVEVISEATCKEHGLEKVYCTGEGCEEYTVVETELAPHDFITVFSPPTESSSGTVAKLCRKCQLFEVERELPPGGDGDPLITVDNAEAISGQTVNVSVKLMNFGTVSQGSFRFVFNTKITVLSVGEASGASDVALGEETLSFKMIDGAECAVIPLTVKIADNASGNLYMSFNYNVDSFTDKDGEPVYPTVGGGYISAVLPENYFGDANGDGDVNIKDVLLMRRYIAGLVDDDEIDLDRADVDRSGSCDIKDVLRIRRFIAGLEDKLYM